MPLMTFLTILGVSLLIWFLNEHFLPRVAGRRQRGWLGTHVRKPITIHLKDDSTMEGLLEAVTSDGIVMRAVSYLDGEGTIPLAGEVFVLRANVAFVQGAAI